jgi:flagellar protein FlaG
MGTDIQSKLPSQASVRVDAPTTASGVKAVPTATHEPEQKAQLAPLPKVDIQFDADKVRKNLEEAIQKLNDMMKDSGRTLSFSMDVKLGRPIVFVKNMANGDVVRQIPSEVVVRVAHGIEDFKGLLHNAAA